MARHTERHGGNRHVSRMARAGTRRRRKGGSGAAPWVISNFGRSTAQQFNNTFGPDSLTHAGSLIPTLPGAPAVGPDNLPQGSTYTYVKQQGGRRKRNKKGGYWAAVIEQALVPFGLLGLQQTYGRRKRGGKKGTKKRH